MEHIKNTTELIGIKDPNIKNNQIFNDENRITIKATPDYMPPTFPHCEGKDDSIWIPKGLQNSHP